MKVQALTNVRYLNIKYMEGEEFEHESPKDAIKAGLLKLVENGKECKSKGLGRTEIKVQGEAIED